MRIPRLQMDDPERLALKKAARAAIVVPLALAFAETVIQQPETTIFTAFGSFAVLVLADFRGSPRARLVAYLALAGAGALFITLGTLCSRSEWVAPLVMALVGFAVLFSTALGPYFAAAGWAPLLTYILPVALPAAPSAIPERLAGWAIACGAGIAAAMLLWPPRHIRVLREAAARACRSLAALVAGELEGDAAARVATARDDVANLRWRFASTPYRPTGPTRSGSALAFLVDELEWFLSIAGQPAASERVPKAVVEADRTVLEAVASTLDASAAVLDGGGEAPDLARLDRARDHAADALAGELAERSDEVFDEALEATFRARKLAVAAGEIGANAIRAAGLGRRDLDAATARAALDESRSFVRGYGGLGAVQLRNSIRGAAALSVAVLIAKQVSLQHSFWIVLGTLSVLRSNALGTGASVVGALAGTAAGLLVGVGLVLAVGTEEWLLWALLPPAVLLAAYAPDAISFAAGQAGFTVTLLIVFNIIQPTGWTVGLVRIEDVTIGFAVSLAFGMLFWPRGAAALMRRSLATTYASGAEYLAAAVQQLTTGRDGARARREAKAAAYRLDDVFRQVLGELSGDRGRLACVSVLVEGATRLRLAAESLWMLAGGSARGAAYADALHADLGRVPAWYAALAEAIADGREPPPPTEEGPVRYRRVVAAARQAAAAGAGPTALALLWAAAHLRDLRVLERDLTGPAASLAGNSARGIIHPMPCGATP